MTAAQEMSKFAANLAFEDIPTEVVQRAKACMIDTIGDAIYGSRVAQGKIILDHVRRTSAPGNASIIGTAFKVQPPLAALANAAFSHAFELDSMCQPSVGSHPGAALTPSGLAIAQTKSASGKELITAFVAGSEVMYRIGDAAHHSSEKLGFHAPGLLSVFGGIITAGKLMGLDTERMTNALGIGGSLCAGLLEFTKSGGGMVKCLHLGHANEGALTALSLAESGFTGPPSVFEGKFGFLNVYCRDAEPGKMTADFGKVWHTLTITLKCFACHSTAHVAVIAALDLKAKHGIVGDNIASIRVAGGEKLISHHDIKEPQDIATAQYSANFSVALAFYRNPSDPDVFSTDSVNDPAIRALCRKVTLEPYEGISPTSLTSRVTIRLNDGREFTVDMQHFPGMPQQPFTEEQLWNKFSLVAKALPADRVRKLFDQLLALEKVSDVAKLEFV